MLKGLKIWKEYIRKLLYIMDRKQKMLAVILLVIVVFNAVLQTVSVYAISPLVSSMTNKEMFLSNNVIKGISGICGTDDYTYLFCVLCACIAILYLLKEAVSVFQVWYGTKFAHKVVREVSRNVLVSYMTREYDFFLGYGTAKVMRDVKEDPSSVSNMITCLNNLSTEVFTTVMLLSYIVISDLQMAICLGILAIFCFFIIFYGFKRKLLKNGNEARVTSAASQKVLLEAVEGVKEVQVMKKQKFFIDSFYASSIKAQRPFVFQNIAANSPTNIVEGIFVAGIMFFLSIKAVNDSNFWNELPVLATFMVAAIRLLPSIGRITNNVNNIQFFVPALESVYENVRLMKESDKSGDTMTDDNGDCLDFMDTLELSNIYYHYNDSDKPVLKGLNLTIHKGESVGIIGQSGAGKSTLADIILGLHIPQEGMVRIDGRNIYDIPFGYSKVIGYVPQNVYLVDGTIKENIAFGEPLDLIDEGRVIEALKMARLYEFVMNSENGLDTIVGERGVKFSGGQRQRLAIARALYRKPQILILDEATSALDNETESAVMEQVEELQGAITLIIIAHRLSTIEKCDSVYEIVNGKAVKNR